MAEFKIEVTEFKRMNDPVDKVSKHVKYVCYANANSLSRELESWMQTNPREQKMTTNVAKSISDSLSNNLNFHELNRGVLLSANSVSYDNQTKTATLILTDPEKHGNIDGGHTLRAIFEAKSAGSLLKDRYVFLEIFTGLDSPVELAEARNTSVQVDLKSIEELKSSFDVLKKCFSDVVFSSRIAYKMNEHYNQPDISPIDIREIITIINMFNQALYPLHSNDGRLADLQPIQSYTGKESSLKRFLNLGKENRESIVMNMSPLFDEIFALWDSVEVEFPTMAAKSGKRYGTRKYSKFDDNNVVGKSLFTESDLYYIIPKGIIYPIVGAFRALVEVNNNQYTWSKSPKECWNILGPQLVSIVLEEKTESPDALGKNTNLWSNLFKEVYIWGRSM